MKIFKMSFVRKIRGVLVVLSLFGFVVQSEATVYTLTHKNSVATFDIGAGPDSWNAWKINGQDQLNNSWFYYRVGGSGPEYPIENLDATPVINQYANLPTFSRLDLTYANSDYSVRTLYTLTGQVGNKATMGETITVTNSSASTVVFHLFQYNDFDLFGSLVGQSVQYTTNTVNGQYSIATQTAGGAYIQERITSASPVIGHLEAATFSATLTKLTDGDADDLNDSTSAGPGNVTFAYQWDVELAPGGTFQISKILEINVPEPSSLALVSLGGFILGWMKRRRMA